MAAAEREALWNTQIKDIESCLQSIEVAVFCYSVLLAWAAGLQVHPDLPHPRRSQTHPDQTVPHGVRVPGGPEEEGKSAHSTCLHGVWLARWQTLADAVKSFSKLYLIKTSGRTRSQAGQQKKRK